MTDAGEIDGFVNTQGTADELSGAPLAGGLPLVQLHRHPLTP